MDKYDEAIAYLTEHPKQIYDAWEEWDSPDLDHLAHCLFQRVDPTGRDESFGCLTLIRIGTAEAYTEELTNEIRADSRIPRNPDEITVNDLPVFAEWQRLIDKELGRE